MKRSREEVLIGQAKDAAKIFKTICEEFSVPVTKEDVFALMKTIVWSDYSGEEEECINTSDTESMTTMSTDAQGGDQEVQEHEHEKDEQEHTSGIVIYVLELENGKYYVGRSDDDEGVDMRIEEHKQGSGSSWTGKHKFVREIMRKHNCSPSEEDMLTVQMMHEKGMNSVRGGSYCNSKLQEYQERAVRDQISTMTGRCFKCLKVGHFRNECVN